MLVQILDIAGGWANGTRVRLLATQSWTPLKNVKHGLRRTEDAKGNPMYHAETLCLDPYKEFHVRVIKDEKSTTEKTVKYRKEDLMQIAPRKETGKTKFTLHSQYTQLPVTPAYALTAHKAQGLTMDKVYISWVHMFGFGVPYTMMTRTPHEDNIYFVGVPPQDVFQRLDERDATDQTPVDREHTRLCRLLEDPVAMEHELQRRNDQGDPVTMDEMTEAYEDTRYRLANHFEGKQRMLEASEGFKLRGQELLQYDDKRRTWPSLNEILQIDADGRPEFYGSPPS